MLIDDCFIYIFPLCLYGSSYFELLNPLLWCRTISNNPDSLRWGTIARFIGCFQPGPLLTPELLILLCWDDGGSLRPGSCLLCLRCELWDVDVPIVRSSAEHAEKEKRWDSFCSQRMSKSKFAPGQQFMLPKSNVHGSQIQVLSCRCWVKRLSYLSSPRFSSSALSPEHIPESQRLLSGRRAFRSVLLNTSGLGFIKASVNKTKDKRSLCSLSSSI